MTVLKSSAKTYLARKLIAQSVNADMHDIGSYDVVPGDKAPTMSGSRCGPRYETKGGRTIYHPSAYKKIGWSNMVYVGAEFYEVECGLEWLRAKCKGKLYRSFCAILADVGRKENAWKIALRGKQHLKPVTLSLVQRLKEHKKAVRVRELNAAGFGVHDNFYNIRVSCNDQEIYFDHVPTVAEVMHEFRDVINRKNAEYASQINLPSGQIKFNSEGGFRIVPSNN